MKHTYRAVLYIDPTDYKDLQKILIDSDDRSVSAWFRAQVKKFVEENKEVPQEPTA